ncbi:hypothetical protein Ddye_025395 [Dipteronia dyeriana]|uniref:Small ribosomal subunit protein uS7 domain-containing protein n=1 Tax=Dipteronia dyeriana TaxID=168575 RepID=A0AAD9TX43_9ROSI|nr:hypothetical protein Ddye_025395 [Dipteronia dyeriana]
MQKNRLVNMLVNRILKHGKKSLAYQIIYRALKMIQQKTEKNPLSVLRQAIRGVTPDRAVKVRRVGGSTHQVPIERGSAQGKSLSVRWLLGASRKRPGSKYDFQIKFRINGCCQKGVAMPYAKRKRLIEWQRQIELLHIFVNP